MKREHLKRILTCLPEVAGPLRPLRPVRDVTIQCSRQFVRQFTPISGASVASQFARVS
jgi:hypothetical protein